MILWAPRLLTFHPMSVVKSYQSLPVRTVQGQRIVQAVRLLW